MTSRGNREDYQNFPWLIFKLSEQQYAINCRYVLTIQNKPSEILPALEAPHYVRGLISVRGEIVPLVSTRRLFGMNSQTESGKAFKKLIEEVKQEHGKFIDLIDTCVKSKSKVEFPALIEELSLYKWVTTYKSENQKLTAHLKLTLEPLQLLFDACMALNQMEDYQRSDRDYVKLRRAKEEHAARIIELLEESNRIFADSVAGKVIILNNGEYSVGYTIDDVLSVEEIEVITTSENTKSIESSRYLYGVGTRVQDKDEKILLLLEDDALLMTVVDYTGIN